MLAPAGIRKSPALMLVLPSTRWAIWVKMKALETRPCSSSRWAALVRVLPDSTRKVVSALEGPAP
ncbi:hypothetical protein D3C86_2084220 [compost metagenome]